MALPSSCNLRQPRSSIAKCTAPQPKREQLRSALLRCAAQRSAALRHPPHHPSARYIPACTFPESPSTRLPETSSASLFHRHCAPTLLTCPWLTYLYKRHSSIPDKSYDIAAPINIWTALSARPFVPYIPPHHHYAPPVQYTPTAHILLYVTRRSVMLFPPLAASMRCHASPHACHSIRRR